LSPASAVAFDGGVPIRHIRRSGEFGEIVHGGMYWVDPKAHEALDGADGGRGDAATQPRDRRAGR